MKFHLVKINKVNIVLKHIGIILLAISTTVSVYSQNDIPDRPNPPRLVNDLTNTLNRNQIITLEQKLENFSNTTSNQVVIFITNDLKGYDVAEFADRIGQKWGVGQQEFDNGVIIIVKPKTARVKGQVWISVGYGLDGAIPDLTANRIIDNEMIPSFKQNDYFTALEKSTTVLMALAAGEYNSDEYAKKTEGSPFGFLVPIIAILFFLVLSRAGRSGSQTYGRRGGGMPLLAMFFLGSAMGRGSHHGSFGNFSGGSGGLGGGGGFGGFGGGGFGGGGAGGSW
ncbi:MAG: TPM domain-containing protein [Bacteroidetes bacterium]|nr:TPM domain-containing protein [Bacteroidota bacterium]